MTQTRGGHVMPAEARTARHTTHTDQEEDQRRAVAYTSECAPRADCPLETVPDSEAAVAACCRRPVSDRRDRSVSELAQPGGAYPGVDGCGDVAAQCRVWQALLVLTMVVNAAVVTGEMLAAAAEVSPAVVDRVVCGLVDTGVLAPADGGFRWCASGRSGLAAPTPPAPTEHVATVCVPPGWAPQRSVRVRILRRLLCWYAVNARLAGAVVMPAHADPLPEHLPWIGARPSSALIASTTAWDWLHGEADTMAAAVSAARPDVDEPLLAVAVIAVADALQPLVLAHQRWRLAVQVDTASWQAARSVGDGEAERRVCARLAVAHARLGDAEQAAEVAGALVDAAIRGDDPQARAAAWSTSAIVRAADADLPGAVHAAQRAAHLFGTLGDRSQQAHALLTLGQSLLRQQRPDQAEPLLRQARHQFSAAVVPDMFCRAQADAALAEAVRDDAEASRLRASAALILTAHQTTSDGTTTQPYHAADPLAGPAQHCPRSPSVPATGRPHRRQP